MPQALALASILSPQGRGSPGHGPSGLNAGCLDFIWFRKEKRLDLPYLNGSQPSFLFRFEFHLASVKDILNLIRILTKVSHGKHQK